MLRQYIQYLKDNPQGYWFRRKLFGWGWVPVKWQAPTPFVYNKNDVHVLCIYPQE